MLKIFICRSLLGTAFLGPGSAHFINAVTTHNTVQIISATVEIIAGLGFILGVHLRWLALAAATFMMIDAFVSHDFWNAPANEIYNQTLHFFKNIALVGGFYFFALSKNTCGKNRFSKNENFNQDSNQRLD